MNQTDSARSIFLGSDATRRIMSFDNILEIAEKGIYMSRLTELETTGEKEFIAPCDCRDGEYLRISWEDEDEDFRMLWIETSPSPRIKDRAKYAWRVFWQRRTGNGIMLNDRTVSSLIEFLEEVNEVPE